MQTNDLKRNKANRKAKQVGRGGTRGKTSGRGTKGQNARSGRKKRPEMRDFIKKIPKLRGRGRNFLKSRLKESFAVNLSLIDSMFSNGETVNFQYLVDKKIINPKKSERLSVKILGNGGIKKSLNFEGLKISEKARKLIKEAGGKINNE